MAKNITQRTEIVEVVDDDSGDKMRFEVRGLGAAATAELISVIQENNVGDTYRIGLKYGVVRVIEGLEKDGKVINAADYDLGDLLSLKEANPLINKIFELSKLSSTEKKD